MMSGFIFIAALSAVQPVRFLGDEGPDTFRVPKILKKSVVFWTALYSKYTSAEVLLYDPRNMDVHYGTVDVSDLQPSAGESAGARRARIDKREKRVQTAKERLVATMRKLAANWGARDRATLSGEEARIAKVLAHVKDGRAIALAATVKRVGGIPGIANRFKLGIERYTAYRPYVLAILREHNLPEEIEALTFTESLFSPTALSRSAAYGAWQFLKSTGKLYLSINDLVDERRDPILATVGAARMLAQNLEMLKKWPLALTGYNYGPYGMKRAAEEVGSYDLADVLTKFRNKRFAFDGRNYYAAFLGSLATLRGWKKHFPDLVSQPTVLFKTIALSRAVTLKVAAARLGVEVGELARLNMALNAATLRTMRMPEGYWLRIPPEVVQKAGGLGKVVAQNDVAGPGRLMVHTVKRRESIYSIAMKYGVPPATLRQLNGVPVGKMLVVGQSIKFPAIDRRKSFTRLVITEPRGSDRLDGKVAFPRGDGRTSRGDDVSADEVAPTREPLSAPDALRPGDEAGVLNDGGGAGVGGGGLVPETSGDSPAGERMTVWVRGARALAPQRGHVRGLPGETLLLLAEFAEGSVKGLARANPAIRRGSVEGKSVRIELTQVSRMRFAARRVEFQKRRLDELVLKAHVERTVTHTIARNDRIERLVPEKYNSTKRLIETFNPGVDLDRLRIGEKLLIPIVSQ